MKLYVCRSHDGHYLGGCSVVVASSEKEARELLDVELIAQKLKPYAESPYELERVAMSKPRLIMLFNGDY